MSSLFPLIFSLPVRKARMPLDVPLSIPSINPLETVTDMSAASRLFFSTPAKTPSLIVNT